MNVDNKMIHQFAKMFDLPMSVTRPEFLEYNLELLDEFYNIKHKWNIFIESYAKNGDKVNNLNYHYRELMKKQIQDSDRYAKFLSDEVPEYKAIPSRDLYVIPFADKFFISVDLVKGNFQSFKYFNYDIFMGAKTFEDYIEIYTKDDPILKESKILRQILFGELNPNKQRKFQSVMMSKIKDLIDSLELFTNEIWSLSSDEIFFEVSEDDVKYIDMLKDEIFIKLDIDVRVEHFQLIQPFQEKSFYKKFSHDKAHEIRLVDKTLLPEFIRKIKKEDLIDKDFYFINSNKLLSKHVEEYYHAK